MDDTGGRRLADLYRRHVPDMVRLAYVLTGDAAAAEDLAHDAFVRVAGRFVHLRNPGAFEPYLRRALVNGCKNHFRRRDRERAYLRTHRPESRDAELDAYPVLREALLRLPHRQRAAIVLRYFVDLSERDTADVLGCRPGTVKSLISRGFDALRATLATGVEQ